MTHDSDLRQWLTECERQLLRAQDRIAELERLAADLEAANAELRARLDYPVKPHDARMDRP
jgi:hypothetical protein